MKICRVWSIPSLPLQPGPQWPEAIVSVGISSMCQKILHEYGVYKKGILDIMLYSHMQIHAEKITTQYIITSEVFLEKYAPLTLL